MTTVTLTVPDDVKSEMKKFAWVNWSEAARDALLREEELKTAFEEFKRIVSKSKLTEKDADELANAVKKSMHERYKGLYKELR